MNNLQEAKKYITTKLDVRTGNPFIIDTNMLYNTDRPYVQYQVYSIKDSKKGDNDSNRMPLDLRSIVRYNCIYHRIDNKKQSSILEATPINEFILNIFSRPQQLIEGGLKPEDIFKIYYLIYKYISNNIFYKVMKETQNIVTELTSMPRVEKKGIYNLELGESNYINMQLLLIKRPEALDLFLKMTLETFHNICYKQQLNIAFTLFNPAASYNEIFNSFVRNQQSYTTVVKLPDPNQKEEEVVRHVIKVTKNSSEKDKKTANLARKYNKNLQLFHDKHYVYSMLLNLPRSLDNLQIILATKDKEKINVTASNKNQLEHYLCMYVTWNTLISFLNATKPMLDLTDRPEGAKFISLDTLDEGTFGIMRFEAEEKIKMSPSKFVSLSPLFFNGDSLIMSYNQYKNLLHAFDVMSQNIMLYITSYHIDDLGNYNGYKIQT